MENQFDVLKPTVPKIRFTTYFLQYLVPSMFYKLITNENLLIYRATSSSSVIRYLRWTRRKAQKDVPKAETVIVM